jgi:hypothetical protein
MKVIGKRKLRELEAEPSGSLLAESARFNDGLADVPGIGSTFIPKGIYRFKSADEADSHRQRCLAEGMAGLANQRR